MNSLSPALEHADLANRPVKIHPALLQIVAISPVIWWFGMRMNDGTDEPLGLLTLALALVLAWRDRASLHAGAGARVFGAVLVLCSVAGIHWLPPMVRGGLAVSGMAFCYGVHHRAGLMGLLFLSLPLAASMQFFLGYPLRIAAAEGAVRLLELASLVVSRSGTQIELGGQVIGVDPACGGVRMLWHALAAAMGLAAIHRLTWRATIIGGLLAVVLVIPANAVRAALLAVKESGHLPGMIVGHGEIGLLSFAVVLLPLWWAISSRARVMAVAGPASPVGRLEMMILAAAAVLAPVLAMGTPRVPAPPDLGVGPEVFSFQGMTLPLEPMALTATESAFASSFPGTLASYRWGESQVILRRVTESTRRLHPSRDCLRAAGFETTDARTVGTGKGGQWSVFQATREGERFTVHERITSEMNDAVWTDVSAWYWSALMNPLNGPWQAETVISR